MSDEIDVGILHETLLHLMTDHQPIKLRVTVEFDSEWGESSSSCSHPPNVWSLDDSQPTEAPSPENTDNDEPDKNASPTKE